MNGQKKKRINDSLLDEIGQKIVLASAMNEDAADSIAASPFLYTRLRARINVERERSAEKESWLAFIGVMWRAAPAMVLITILSFALLINIAPRSSERLSDTALLGSPEAAGVEHVVFAERTSLTGDEILTTILSKEE